LEPRIWHAARLHGDAAADSVGGAKSNKTR
jgi:hypothetical protein